MSNYISDVKTLRRMGVGGSLAAYLSVIESSGRSMVFAWLDGANWRKRKGRIARRNSTTAAHNVAHAGNRARKLANASCAFLLSNGATASHFAALTPP